jgi:RNA 3'-terminal phosphate cyclase-like protein
MHQGRNIALRCSWRSLLSFLLQVRLGPLTPYAVHTLRHIREFFNVQFSMRTEQQSGTIFLSCIGAGLKNINRKVT